MGNSLSYFDNLLPRTNIRTYFHAKLTCAINGSNKNAKLLGVGLLCYVQGMPSKLPKGAGLFL